jgi:hypothetical protein
VCASSAQHVYRQMLTPLSYCPPPNMFSQSCSILGNDTPPNASIPFPEVWHVVGGGDSNVCMHTTQGLVALADASAQCSRSKFSPVDSFSGFGTPGFGTPPTPSSQSNASDSDMSRPYSFTSSAGTSPCPLYPSLFFPFLSLRRVSEGQREQRWERVSEWK